MKDYQEILERYAEQVVRSFSKKDAEEIKRELVSSLEDNLEDRLEGAQPTIEDALELVKEFGSPSELAEEYRPSRYLISPRMFAPYTTTLKIMLLVQVILFTVLGLISLAAFGDVEDFFIFIGNFISSVLSGFGVITIIFWIIDRYAPKAMVLVAEEVDQEFKPKEWDPNNLRNPNPEYVRKFWLIIEAVILAAMLFVLNFFPDVLNFYSFSSGDTGDFIFLPIFGEGIRTILPAISIIWGLKIAFNMYMLTQYTWNETTRWLKTATDIIGLVVLYLMVTTENVFALSYNDLIAGGFPEDVAETLSGILPVGVRGGLLIALIINVILQGINVIQKVLKREWIKM